MYQLIKFIKSGHRAFAVPKCKADICNPLRALRSIHLPFSGHCRLLPRSLTYRFFIPGNLPLHHKRAQRHRKRYGKHDSKTAGQPLHANAAGHDAIAPVMVSAVITAI